MTEAPAVVALYGATALGKTDVAIGLAERLDADIVVADSMQVYAGLPVLTNQPDAVQARRARHHLVGFVPPQQDYTVAEYARRAHDVIDGLRGAGRAVVVEGGSGLYLRAALGNLQFAAAPDPEMRATLELCWAQDPQGVVAELVALDPAAAAGVDQANPRRVIRALEHALLGGRHAATAHGLGGHGVAMAERDQLWRPPERYPHRLIALAPDGDRTHLKQRIEGRVDEMLAAGAVDEVAAARAAGPLARTALQAIGVREIVAHLDGELTLAEVRTRMAARTRALVRRQLTWMRKLPAAHVVPAEGRHVRAVVDEVMTLAQARAW